MAEKGKEHMTALCPICKIESPHYFSARDFNQKISSDTFHYYRCSSCGLVFLFPVPDNLVAYYIPTYPAYQMPSSQQLETNAAQEYYKLESVQKFITKGRLLEIGPSYGAFAFLAKKAGFEVEAIEMDTRCCQYLTEVVGIKAVNANDINTSLQELMPYDVITLWHVLEHLTSPWETLVALSKKVLPGGILVIAAPNPAAFQFKIFGKYWAHVDAPRHLQLIPMQVLVKYMEPLGMYPVTATTTDKASTIFSTFAWWLASLYNLVKDKAPFLLAEKNSVSKPCTNRPNEAGVTPITTSLSLTRRILSFPFRFVKAVGAACLYLAFSLMLRPIERREKLGCAYTVIFKKS